MPSLSKGDRTARVTGGGDAHVVEMRVPKTRKLHSTPSAAARVNSRVDDGDRADETRPRALLAAAADNGWMGARVRQMGGRFPKGLVEAAQKASGLTEPTDLLTYALAKVAFEDNYGETLLALDGTVPRGTFVED